MHGVLRDGGRYREEWRGLTEKHGLIIVVPRFGRIGFPTTGPNNLGNTGDEKGRRNLRSQWSFSAIEPLFDEIVCCVAGKQRGYALYGHSAGGQFVHRYAAFADLPGLELAAAANSGWCTMPNATAFPYGWGGNATGLVPPAKAFLRPITILLGTEDIDRDDPNLCNNEQADQHGLTRFARRHCFLATARERAGTFVPPGWRIA